MTAARWSGRRLLVVVAHPDDETFGLGSLIADAAVGGADVVVCCATRGEAGELAPGCRPPAGGLAEMRVEELHTAGALLGVREIVLLDFVDSDMSGGAGPETLAGAPLDAVVDAVATVVERVRPDVIVTLDPTGGDGHRDHVRIAEATTVAAGRVAPGAALYHWCVTRSLLQRWLEEQRVAHPELGHLALETAELGRPDDEVTTIVDVRGHVELRRRAIAVHRSQRPPIEGLSDELTAAFLETDRLVRATPAWTGGPLETELAIPSVRG